MSISNLPIMLFNVKTTIIKGHRELMRNHFLLKVIIILRLLREHLITIYNTLKIMHKTTYNIFTITRDAFLKLGKFIIENKCWSSDIFWVLF